MRRFADLVLEENGPRASGAEETGDETTASDRATKGSDNVLKAPETADNLPTEDVLCN